MLLNHRDHVTMLVASAPSLPWKRENLGLMGVKHIKGVKTQPSLHIHSTNVYMTLNNSSTELVPRKIIWSELEDKTREEMKCYKVMKTVGFHHPPERTF